MVKNEAIRVSSNKLICVTDTLKIAGSISANNLFYAWIVKTQPESRHQPKRIKEGI